MSEVLGGSQKKQSVYSTQPEPHQRNQKDRDRWRQIKRDNKLMSRALSEIKREPPSNYHAPKGFDSLRNGSAVKTGRAGKEDSKLPGTQHHLDVPPWPPSDISSQNAQIQRTRTQRAVDEANCHLTKRLVDQYTSQRPRSAHNPSGIWRPDGYRPPDYVTKWAQRTSLYLPQQPPQCSPYAAAVETAKTIQAAAAPIPASSTGPSTITLMGGEVDVGSPMAVKKKPLQRPRSAVTCVPRTLGLAMCAGCGAQAFRGADGVHLEPCKFCKQVWYCSEVCSKLDWRSHKALCKWKTTGHWEPYGRKAEEEHWVSNAALGEVRRELARRGSAALVTQAASSPATTLLAQTLAGGAMVDNPWTPTFADNANHAAGRAGTATGPSAAAGSSSGAEHNVSTAGAGAGHNGTVAGGVQGGGVSGGGSQAGSGRGTGGSQAGGRGTGGSQAGGRGTRAVGSGSQAGGRGTGAVGGGPSQGGVRGSYVGQQVAQGDTQTMDLYLDEVEEVERAYRRAREREKERERKQRLIEERAYMGLDGPRPCMYMGGKPV